MNELKLNESDPKNKIAKISLKYLKIATQLGAFSFSVNSIIRTSNTWKLLPN